MSVLEPTTPNQPILCSPHTPPPLIRTPIPSEMEQSFLDGDFLKPDPAMTRWETRTYILKELKQCLTSVFHQKEESTSFTTQQVDTFLRTHSWPQGRMNHVCRLLEDTNTTKSVIDVAYEILEANLCEEYKELPYSSQLVRAVMGFVTVDTLPCGKTIASFWNHSPFQALRNAPPLSDWEDRSEWEIGWEMPITIPLNVLVYALVVCVAWMACMVATYGKSRSQYS